MRKILFFALVWLIPYGNPAAASESCDISYTDDVRQTLILPALAQFSTFNGGNRDVAASYDLRMQPTIKPTGRSDGTLILAFDEPNTLDGSTLRIVIDPCERKVVYVNERQDNIAFTSLANPFKTDDATLHAELVGSWILPPGNWLDNSNNLDGNPDFKLRMVQTFMANGTGSVDVYKDGTCTTLDRSIHFTWTLKGSALSVSASDIDPKSLLLQSSDIGIAPGRKPEQLASFFPDHNGWNQLNRATRCGWPGNAPH